MALKLTGLRLRGKLTAFVALPVLLAVVLLGISAELLLRQSLMEHTRQQMAQAFERLNFGLQSLESALQSAARLAGQEEALIASVDLVNRYEDKSQYNAALIDEEKKLLAKAALDRVKFSQTSALALYGQNHELLAFASAQSGVYRLGYVSYETGQAQVLVQSEAGPQFAPEDNASTPLPAMYHRADAPGENDALKPVIAYDRQDGQMVIRVHHFLRDTLSQAQIGHIEISHVVDADELARLSKDTGIELTQSFESALAESAAEMRPDGVLPALILNKNAGMQTSVLRRNTLAGPVYFEAAQSIGQTVELVTRQRYQTAVVLLVIAAALLFGIVQVFNHKLMQPLGQLLRQINQVKRGDYAQQTPPATQDELEDLGESINALGRDLLQHESELKRSEQTSHALAASLQEAQAISQLGSWTLELAHGRMAWSAQIYNLLALDAQQVEPSYLGLLAAVHPDDKARVQRVYEAAQANHSGFSIEYRHSLADGSLHWVNARCRFEFDSSGQAFRSAGTLQDITEQKLAELSQAESTNLLMTVIDAIPMRVFWKDIALNYLGCNTRFALDAGKTSAAELIGKDDFQMGWAAQADLYHADDRAVIRSNQPKLNIVEAQTTPDGGLIWLNTSKIPLRGADGESFGILGVYEDITERKKAEEQIRKLSQVSEQSPESVVITDLRGKIEYVNPAYLHNTGYSLDEALGANPRIVQSGGTPRSTFLDMWKHLQLGKSWSGELSNRRKDGSMYTDWAVISPLRDETGSVTHYVALQENITDKKLQAVELDEYRKGLEVMVAQRTQELEAARRQADESNRAKSVFLANMSHEIRTPLHAIAGMTRLIRKEPLTKTQQDRLNKLETAATHLSGTINDILDLSKIEADKLVLEEDPVSVGCMVDNMANILQDRAMQKGLSLRVEVGPLPQGLLGDATRLGQALLNYAGNAIKFTESGSVTVRCHLQEETSECALLRFEVSDTGVGIAPEHLSKLFAPFVQADASTTRKYGGTGLGLAITKRLVAAMGGEAGASSVLGQGSTFWFTARLKKGATVAEHTNDDTHADAASVLNANFSGRRILLAEDDGFNQEIGSLLLQDVGLLVDIAEDGLAACRMAAENAYDLILMDMQMPHLDGLRATRNIRASDTRSTVPIVAMTANAFAEDRVLCLEAGMDDFVTKPIDPVLLYRVLYRQLSRLRA